MRVDPSIARIFSWRGNPLQAACSFTNDRKLITQNDRFLYSIAFVHTNEYYGGMARIHGIVGTCALRAVVVSTFEGQIALMYLFLPEWNIDVLIEQIHILLMKSGTMGIHII